MTARGRSVSGTSARPPDDAQGAGGWLQTFNFQSMGRRSTKRSPSRRSRPAPSAGRKAGLEVRLANGWNYYLEYRNGQGVQIADRTCRRTTLDGRCLGALRAADLASHDPAPQQRHRWRRRGPRQRPGLRGDRYDRSRLSDDFKIDVSGVNGSKADVRVRHGVNSRPDPPSVPGRRA